jgi:hypothetical protein
MRGPAPTLRALVAELVDYAGLFPPAARPMADAVAEFGEHLASPERWMLGRFVVPASRLEELTASPRPASVGSLEPWRVSALLGDDLTLDLRRIADFDAANEGAMSVDTVECRCASARDVVQMVPYLPRRLHAFIEVGLDAEPGAVLQAIRDSGASAKMRTGGVLPSAIPVVGDVARFVARCAELRVPFKATAGLHHPLGGEHALAYDAGAPVGRMYGFLNIFLGAALVRDGMSEDTLAELLLEREPDAFEFGEAEARWRDHVVGLGALTDARASLARAFGSCSFREPVDGLRELRLL